MGHEAMNLEGGKGEGINYIVISKKHLAEMLFVTMLAVIGDLIHQTSKHTNQVWPHLPVKNL